LRSWLARIDHRILGIFGVDQLVEKIIVINPLTACELLLRLLNVSHRGYAIQDAVVSHILGQAFNHTQDLLFD